VTKSVADGFDSSEEITPVEQPPAASAVAIIRELRRLGDQIARQGLAIERLAAAFRELNKQLGQKLVG
jgi:hypothetical protein